MDEPAVPALQKTVDDLVASHRRGVEDALALARIWLCLIAAAVLLVTVVRGFASDPARPAIVGACLLVTIGTSLWIRRSLRAGRPLAALRWLAISLEVLMCLTVLMSEVLWPEPPYFGLFRLGPTWSVLPAIMVNALRLSTRGLVTAGIGYGGVIATLAIVDHVRNGPVIQYVPGHVAVDLVTIAGAGVISALSVRSTRRLVFRGAKAAVDAERARQHLGLYVSEEVAHHALTQEQLRLGGVRQPVAILFSDLRGFTTYSESLAPEQLIAELNAYLASMVAVIRREGGVIDKYIGDAIMAVFGIPEPRKDDPIRAIRAALAMQRALCEHNANRRALGQPELVQGIGVHHGPAIAGHVGSVDRLQYTVLGDTVNVASRLEGLTKERGVSILVSEECADAARAAATELSIGVDELLGLVPLGEVDVRGRSGGLRVLGFERKGAEP